MHMVTAVLRFKDSTSLEIGMVIFISAKFVASFESPFASEPNIITDFRGSFMSVILNAPF